MATDYPQKFFQTVQEWEEWLDKSHKQETGVWLKFAKKESGEISVTYAEALMVALCFGWIDGQAKALDSRYYLQKFTKRGPRSMWSKKNREHVERLTRDGLMKSAGQQAVDEAKADGRWDQAYDSPSTMEIPQDFLKRLADDPKAEAFYATLNKANRYAIGYRLQTAKKPETRERRIKTILTMLHDGKKFH